MISSVDRRWSLAACLAVLLPLLPDAAGMGPLAVAPATSSRIDPDRQWQEATRRGDLLAREGDLSGARKSYATALALAERLGDDQDRLSDSLRDLAETFESAGDYSKAAALYERCLRLRKRRFGAFSQRLDPLMRRLAAVYVRQNRLEDAHAMLSGVVALRRRLFSIDQPLLFTAIRDLSDLASRRGNLAESEGLIKELLPSRLQEEPLSHASSLLSLAVLLTSQHKYSEAKDCYQRQLKLLESAGPQASEQTAMVWRLLGKLEQKGGDQAAAESCFRKAAVLAQAANTPGSRELVMCLASLGICLAAQHKFEEAEPIFKRYLALESTVSGENSENMRRASARVAEFYASWRQFRKH